jgi:hypothetical protein
LLRDRPSGDALQAVVGLPAQSDGRYGSGWSGGVFAPVTPPRTRLIAMR